VAADGGGREPEPAAERGRGGRPELEDQPGDLPPGGGTARPAAWRSARRSSTDRTPDGVGGARQPRVWLGAGDELVVSSPTLGRLTTKIAR